MTAADAPDAIAAEEQIPDDDLHIDDAWMNDPELKTGESDVPHSTTTQTEPTHRATSTDGPAGTRRPDPSQGLDLDEMDIGELEQLTARIASGEIPLEPLPQTDPFEDVIDTMDDDEAPEPAAAVDDSPASVAKPGPVEMAPPQGEAADDPATAKDPKVRVRLTTDDDRAIVAAAKEKGITLLEAAAEVLAQKRAAAAESIDDLVEDDPAADPKPAPAAAKDAPFATVADAEERLYALEAEADAAQFREYDDEKAFRLREEIRTLRRQMPAIREAESAERERRLESERAAYERTWAESEAKAREVFPELDDPASPIHAEMSRLDAEARATGAPVWSSASKFFDLAVEARRNLARSGVAPSSPMSVSTGPAPIPVSPPRNPAARGVSASPAARATTPAPAVPRIEQRIDEVADADDLEDLYASLSGRR